MPRKSKSHLPNQPAAKEAGRAKSGRPLGEEPSLNEQGVHVTVSHERKWWETWWGTSLLLTSTGIIAGLIVWQVSERFSKPPARLPTLSATMDSQTIPTQGGGSVTVTPDGRLKTINLNGIRIDFSNTDSSVTAVSSNSATLTPEVKRLIAEQVKEQVDAVKRAQNSSSGKRPAKPTDDQVPPALDPARRVFVVDSDLTVDAHGQACSLSIGDVITRVTDTPDQQNRVDVSVSASKKGDCSSGTTVAVSVDALQQMNEHFQQQLDEGLGELARKQSTGGLPEGPKN